MGIVLWFNKLIDVLEVAQPKPCLSNSMWILSLQLGLAWCLLGRRCPAVFLYMYTKIPKYLVGQIRKQFFFLFPFLSLTHSPFFPSDLKIQPSHDADWESLICCSFDSNRPWIMAKWLPSICANTLPDLHRFPGKLKSSLIYQIVVMMSLMWHSLWLVTSIPRLFLGKRQPSMLQWPRGSHDPKEIPCDYGIVRCK